MTIITPKLEFETASVEQIIDVLNGFLEGDKKGWIFSAYPELRGKLEGKPKSKREEVIYDFFKNIEKKADLEKKSREFQRSWDDINDKIMKALSNIVEIEWPDNCKIITGRVTVNPVCPRYLDFRTFDVNYQFDANKMRPVSIHELLHFIYFGKWKETFPRAKRREFDNPYLVWKLSEIVPKAILSDKRIQRVYKNEPQVYNKFYDIKIKDRAMLDYFQEIYEDRKDFADFLRKSWAFANKHKDKMG